MRIPDWPLQQAIFSRLKARLNVPVFDEVPQGSKYPYILIGESTGVNDGAKTMTAVDATVSIFVYSGAPGMREVKELMATVVSALTDEPIPMSDGWANLRPRLEFNEAMRDPDGKTRHGVVRIRVKVTEG